MSLKHFLTKHVYNVVRTTTTKKKMGELRQKIGVLCFAYFTLASAKSPCFLTIQRSLFFNRAHNTNQLSLCLDSGRLCHSRQFREWLWTADTCRSPFLRSKAKLLLHNFLSVVVNRSCLMRVFLQRLIFKQFAAPSSESFFWPSFHFHSFTKSVHQHIKNADLV